MRNATQYTKAQVKHKAAALAKGEALKTLRAAVAALQEDANEATRAAHVKALQEFRAAAKAWQAAASADPGPLSWF